MKKEFLKFLACPICRSELSFHQDAGPEERVESGFLSCVSGCGNFPIQGGTPRLLPELASQRQKHLDAVESQKRTSSSFGAQWNMYEYGGTTWGVTVEERIHVVLHELDWSLEQIQGKVILDAGCGNGTLSCALAEHGATVIAMDLSESVFRAKESCRSSNILFVQGNLFFPPFQRQIFDAIYSCGVFHHTPDTRRCFDELVPALKKDAESRYFVWLYSDRSWFFNLTVEHLMKLTRRMQSSILVPLCALIAPFVEEVLRGAAMLGYPKDGKRTIRDRTIQLHDLLSPAFVWYHQYDEVKNWAQDAGFQNIQETVYSGNNGYPHAVQDVLDKYLLICRPGFGMLARY